MNVYNIELSERLALYSSYLVPIGIIFLSLVSIFNDTMINPDMRALVLDLIFLLLGALLLSGAYRINSKFRRNLLADREFRYLLLEKFEPFLKELSKYQIAIDDLSQKVDALNKRVSYISKEGLILGSYTPRVPFAPNITFLIRSLNLSMLTLGAMIFLYIKLSPNSIYVILVLILLWWYLITDEYDLFSDISAYIFVIFPILVIPITSLILLAYFDLQTLHIFLFLTLVLYIVGYYAIATYYATGRIPFIERPLEIYRDRGKGVKMRNGGTSATPAEVKEILDKIIVNSYQNNASPPPNEGSKRHGAKDYGYHRQGVCISTSDNSITITLDKDTLVEILALYLAMQGTSRRRKLFDSSKPSFTQSFLYALYKKLKKFR